MVAAGAGAIGWAAPSARAAGGPKVDFNRDVRPILSQHCFVCHGQDEAKRARGLRLDRREVATAPLKSGETAIVPGDVDASELMFRVTEEDETVRMPPKKAGPRLSAAEIDVLKRWIEQGAEYARHWALVPPSAAPLPKVHDAAWPRDGIDYFVLERLERAGTRPSPEADRAVLLRRASLDLRGLPPTLEELDRFLNDAAPGAYERAVDRFLQDPAYGERWARMWLDLARYADSAGYGSDPLRLNIWQYRDWVIRAFNRNLPYDRFTLLQLAGDMLPAPTLQDRIATAFHRNTMTNTEGGTDDEEFRVAAIKDRVDTTMQVWMGLTMGCAKCHSHKYDPITQTEYYAFFAIFNQSADADRADEAPVIVAPTPEYQAELRQYRSQMASARQRLASASATPKMIEARERWEAALAPDSKNAAPREKVPAKILVLLDLPAQKRTKEQSVELDRYYQSVAPELNELYDLVRKMERTPPQGPTVPVMEELPPAKHRVTHLLHKGNFLDPGEVVAPGVPASLNPLPSGEKADRLGLARWLAADDNPLTARVAVNRFWAQLFGVGLVETEEDFGTQGEPPSHPELLDWLAVRYRESGWDTKALLRSIVTSATYRQSARARPELREQDPRNRLLARMPRVRLEAEMVRDQALALSGLLCRKVGGPSVFPPQPEGLWQAAFNGQRSWTTSTGGDRYRRGLYVFWRRSVPYPSMAAFDAPSREICAIKRSRTNTPLQSFVTLNDPVYVAAAQALARRIVREGGGDVASKARYGLRLCLCRPVPARQAEPLVTLYRDELERYRADRAAALALATDPLGPAPSGMDLAELAAWTTVANVLLNQDAVLTKD